MEIKWRKLPKPEALAKLPEGVVRVGIPFLQAEAPRLADLIVRRTSSGFGVDLNGERRELPPLSNAYAAAKAGRDRKAPATPRRATYSLSGNLLDHLSGKIKANGRKDLSLVIAAYGRTGDAEAKVRALNVRATVERSGYTYTSKHGKTVVVGPSKAQIKVLDQWQRKQRAKEREGSALRYNAHLAWALAHRTGQGRIAGLSGPPTHHFIRLTNQDLADLRGRWVDALSAAGIFGVWATNRVAVR